MKVTHATNPVERAGTQMSGEFKIKATAKAFNILSSGLYSDKILAVIRELSCNAHDAHVAAGKSDVPFEIHLPTTFEPTFYVKDFGIGLSEADVMNLYTTYFDSTKADSNEFIGALGLGSKSPFSYTNSFTVESRFNGTKHVFNAFLNEDGLPEIAKLGSSPTDEGNGLTVLFSARKEDISTFHTKARQALMYFNPQPTIKNYSGYSQLKVKTLFKGDRWAFVERESSDYYTRRDGPAVKQGPVIYPINADILRREKMSKMASKILGLSLDIEVPMGMVDVAASREALSYDKRTVANLIAEFERIGYEFSNQISSTIANAKTLWEARFLLSKLIKDGQSLSMVVRDLITSNSLKVEWRGQKVETAFKADLSFIKHTNIIHLRKNSWQKKLFRSAVNLLSTDVEAKENFFVIVADYPNKAASTDTIHQWMANWVNKHNSDVNVLMLVPGVKNLLLETKKEAQQIIKTFGGGPEVMYASQLGYTPTKKVYTYKARSKTDVLAWRGFAETKDHRGRKNGYNYTYSRLTWETESVDFQDGGLYVLVERFTPMHDGKEINRLDRIVTLCKALNIPTNFYAMNAKQLAVAQEDGEWEEFIPYVIEKVKELNKNNAITDSVSASQLQRELGGFTKQLPTWVKLLDQRNNKTTAFAEMIRELNDAVVAKYPNDTDIAYGLGELGMGEIADASKRVRELTNNWSATRAMYPMLRFVNLGYDMSSSDNMNAILDYVESV